LAARLEEVAALLPPSAPLVLRQGPDVGGGPDRLAKPTHEGGQTGVHGEGNLTGGRLDQHQRPCVDVGPAVERFAVKLLGGSVA
jgi:hypothetical protein